MEQFYNQGVKYTETASYYHYSSVLLRSLFSEERRSDELDIRLASKLNRGCLVCLSPGRKNRGLFRENAID
jgi:predicted aldo/keto reductase-like oxidoreductase